MTMQAKCALKQLDRMNKLKSLLHGDDKELLASSEAFSLS